MEVVYMQFSRISVAMSALAITALSFTPAYAQERGRPAAPPRGGGQGQANPNRPAARPPAERPADARRPADAPRRAEFLPRIEARPKLVARLQTLLPEGMTLQDAAAGFRNQGQFIAALHVSKNLDIPFADLKGLMTGPDQKSLGQSIKELRPTVNTDAAVNTAEQQATEDEQVSNQ
ncbi:MAG: hypothetical protein A3G76_15260 [Acidobacteria bacterium RIFCSPLOWO2_12_FULL_65_11]|nr:MAG: hypothetical protein A3G76_15260 [Acidobacteria bacterium RIFCSPLOWO2_12_FULL_65_11]